MRDPLLTLFAVLSLFAACSSDSEADPSAPDSLDATVAEDGLDGVAEGETAHDAADEDVWAPADLLSFAPDDPGPYGVGFREDEVTYVAKPGQVSRTLRAAIWYPTIDAEGETTLYYPGTIKREEILLGAAPAPHAGWPVLVFSHGYSGFAENSYFLCEHFAQHGWLVIAPDHTGNTIEALNAPVDTSMYGYRPQDVTASIDFLELLAEEDPLAGKADTSQVVVTGHSFGGYTTLVSSGASFEMDALLSGCEDGTGHSAFCSTMDAAHEALFAGGLSDARVIAGMPMAPGTASILGPGLSSITAPILQFTGGLDGQTSNDGAGDPIWEGLVGAAHRRVNIETAGHQSFTVVCTWFPLIGADDGCGEGFIDSLEVHRIVNTYALAFARKHRFGDASVDPWLDGEIVVDPEVTLVASD